MMQPAPPKEAFQQGNPADGKHKPIEPHQVILRRPRAKPPEG